MTTEELENKLKISEDTCIHCPTEELAKHVLTIFHQLGLRWNSETSYVSDHYWNAFKGNTLYYPFEGGLSALGSANLTGYKIINAEEFIALHTEEDSQGFRVGDKVIDILLYEVGVVQDINYSPNIPYGLSVEFKSGFKSYTINGCYLPECKNPQLLHYRDDYDYSIIDFNNLPKRQEPKRWRTEKGGEYHYIRFYLEGWFSICATKDDNSFMDNKNYNSGNYFRTEVEAEIIAQKLNTYFKQLIQEEHEHERKEI